MSEVDIPELDPRPARSLTSREIAKVLGGSIGSLYGFCEEQALRDAVRWLAHEERFWDLIRITTPKVEEAVLPEVREYLGLESPDEPLERTYVPGSPVSFSRAVCTIAGTLPPRFDGFVGAQVQGLFRPLEIEVVKTAEFADGPRGRAVAKIGSVTVEPGGRCRVPKPVTVEVGAPIAVRMENPSDEPAAFRVALRGHSGDPHDPGHPVRTYELAPLVPVPEFWRAHTFELPPLDRTP